MHFSRERLERSIACGFRSGIFIVCLIGLASCQRTQQVRSVETPAPPQIAQKPVPNKSAKPVLKLSEMSSYRFAIVASVGNMQAVSQANKALQSAGIASYTVGSRNTFKIQVREQDRTRAVDVLKASSQAGRYTLTLSP